MIHLMKARELLDMYTKRNEWLLKEYFSTNSLVQLKAKLWDMHLFGRPQSNGKIRSHKDNPPEVNNEARR